MTINILYINEIRSLFRYIGESACAKSHVCNTCVARRLIRASLIIVVLSCLTTARRRHWLDSRKQVSRLFVRTSSSQIHNLDKVNFVFRLPKNLKTTNSIFSLKLLLIKFSGKIPLLHVNSTLARKLHSLLPITLFKDVTFTHKFQIKCT
jgi:hypothetical protein